MTKKEFLEEVVDVDSLYNFCCDCGYESYIDDLYSSDSYDEYLGEDFAEAMRYNHWTDVRDMMNDTDDPNESDWWVRDDWSGFRPADNDWFEEQKSNLLEELETDEWFDEDEDEDEDEPEFEVESTAVFLNILWKEN